MGACRIVWTTSFPSRPLLIAVGDFLDAFLKDVEVARGSAEALVRGLNLLLMAPGIRRTSSGTP